MFLKIKLRIHNFWSTNSFGILTLEHIDSTEIQGPTWGYWQYWNPMSRPTQYYRLQSGDIGVILHPWQRDTGKYVARGPLWCSQRPVERSSRAEAASLGRSKRHNVARGRHIFQWHEARGVILTLLYRQADIDIGAYQQDWNPICRGAILNPMYALGRYIGFNINPLHTTTCCLPWEMRQWIFTNDLYNNVFYAQPSHSRQSRTGCKQSFNNT